MPQRAKSNRADRMKILAVGTATTACSVAISQPDGPIAELDFFHGQTHSKHLTSMVDALLEMSAVGIEAVDAFAACAGPGSFTGLRIGMAAVKGMAAAGGKPVVGISSLDTLARQAGSVAGTICPMIDARRHEVYTALYKAQNGTCIKISEEQVIPPQEILDAITGPCLFIGTGAVAYREMILEATGRTARFAGHDNHHPRAATIARLGLKKLQKPGDHHAAGLVPSYIRRSDAENNKIR